MSPSRLWAACVIALCGACARQVATEKRETVRALPSARSSVAPSRPYIGSIPLRKLQGRGKPAVIRVEYEITRDSESEQTLWATIVDLGVRKPIAHSKAPYVCGVIGQPDLNEPLYSRPLAYARIQCGDADLRTWVSMEDDGDYLLELGEHKVQFYRFTTVDHSEIRQPLPPPRNCASKPPVPVKIQIQRDRKGLYLTISELGIRYYMLEEPDFDGRWYCLSTVRKRAQRLDIGCSAPVGGLNASLFIERDVLFLDLHIGSSIGDVYQDSRIGFELPCNAVPRFRGYDYLSPKYGYYDKCFDRCMIRQDHCDRDCNEKFSDARGELDERGRQCVNQCQSEHQVCQRCGSGN